MVLDFWIKEFYLKQILRTLKKKNKGACISSPETGSYKLCPELTKGTVEGGHAFLLCAEKAGH